jgi:hypothetical protein
MAAKVFGALVLDVAYLVCFASFAIASRGLTGEPRGRGGKGRRLCFAGSLCLAKPDGEATENDDENNDSPRRPDPPFGSPPPYRGKNGGGAKGK